MLRTLTYILFFIFVNIQNINAQKQELADWNLDLRIHNVTLQKVNAEEHPLASKESFFYNYNQQQYVSISLLKKIQSNLLFGGNLQALNASKTNISLKSTSIGLQMQYFYPLGKRWALIGEFNPKISFLTINRTAHFTKLTDDLLSKNYSSSSGGLIPDSASYYFSKYNITNAPVLGYNLGIGVEYRFFNGWSIAYDIHYNRNFTKTANYLQNNLPDSESFQKSTMVFRSSGLTLRIPLKRKKASIDSINSVKKTSVVLNPVANSNSKLTIVGKIENKLQLLGQQVLLQNENGKTLAKTQTDKNGNFIFKKLENKYYQIVLDNEVEGALLTAQSYLEDNSVLLIIPDSVSTQKWITGNVPTNSLNGKDVIIVNNKSGEIQRGKVNEKGHFVFRNLANGDYNVLIDNTIVKNDVVLNTVAVPDTIKLILDDVIVGKTQDSSQVLAVNAKGEVVSQTKRGKNGYFAFHKLGEGEFYVVKHSSQNENLSAGVSKSAAAIDPSLNPSFKYRYLKDDKTVEDNHKQLVTGELALGNKFLADQTVLLLDNEGNVIDETKSDNKGKFKFSSLIPNEYNVVLGPNGNLETKINLFGNSDQTTLILDKEEMGFKYKKLNNDTQLQPDNYIISGVVRNSLNAAIEPDMSVLLIDNDGKEIANTSTDKDGTFTFRGLKSDNYKVVVQTSRKDVQLSVQLFSDYNSSENKNSVSSKKLDVLYAKNEYLLNQSQQKELLSLVSKLKSSNSKPKSINIEAYGDETGTDEYNLQLTQKRANEIKSFLQKQGIKIKINAVGLGKAINLADKNATSDPALNRRAEILFVN
ncbi:MAG: hypothetical protein RLZZ175_3091 [Bacteroidota bacterium]|jgi:outer membrane protein OmpA-like peptidoglycan-associated protein